VVEDDSRYPGAACYHTLSEEGLPEVRVAVRDAKKAQWPWTMAASHDLLEMLANPRLNLTIFDTADAQEGRLYIREICDPVSNPRLAYRIDDATVSNFVYPAWFERFRAPGGKQFDHRGHLKAPFEVAPGCYVYFWEVKSSGRSAHFEPSPKQPTSSEAKTRAKLKTQPKSKNKTKVKAKRRPMVRKARA
jgi:hypothetical protein